MEFVIQPLSEVFIYGSAESPNLTSFRLVSPSYLNSSDITESQQQESGHESEYCQ
ncbi:MAG: hypothetical protein MI754_07450 [Chromatiales bacterium]|nr:hypothetical protein [Chromatiales bacterium]